MNITDAILIDPIAMDHARQILARELDMLHKGVGRKKRIEWLSTQRDVQCRDAALFIPSQLAPALESLTTRDSIALLEIVRGRLTALNIGTTFRHLRNAERRMGLPGNVLDPLLQQGAMLLLADDEDFVAALRRAVEPLLQHMESTPAFGNAEKQYAEIMSRTDLETNKQRSVIEHVMQVFPDMLTGMPEPTDRNVRDIAYVYGRLLDQDLMLALTAIIREVGAGIFDQLSADIISRAITTYRVVVMGLINDRISELQEDRQPVVTELMSTDVAPTTTNPDPAQVNVTTHPPDLLSIIETADYLRVTRTTIYRLIKSGALTGTHVGRRHLITRKSIENYLALSGNE